MTPAIALQRAPGADHFLAGAGAMLLIASAAGLQLGWSGGIVAATKLVAIEAVQAGSHPVTLAGMAGQRLVSPLPGGKLTQAFGPTPHSSEPAFAGYAHFHPGIDLAADAGSPVFAAADGLVTIALSRESDGTGYGEYVVLSHSGNSQTVYAHLEAVLVTPWMQVKKGQILGLVGSTGNSTGPHLHFEYWLNGKPVDPLAYISTSSSPPNS
jgi:murein DD-endopeptidase MepM/ murein hydrolase activator NlpD